MIFIVANKIVLFYSSLVSHSWRNVTMQLHHHVNKTSQLHIFVARKQIQTACSVAATITNNINLLYHFLYEDHTQCWSWQIMAIHITLDCCPPSIRFIVSITVTKLTDLLNFFVLPTHLKTTSIWLEAMLGTIDMDIYG